MRFRPLHDRVVVRRIDAEEKTAGEPSTSTRRTRIASSAHRSGLASRPPGDGSCGRKTMAAKEVKFSTEARDKMLRGVDILNNAVKVTLGPK